MARRIVTGKLKEAAGGGGITENNANATQSINVKDASTRNTENGGKWTDERKAGQRWGKNWIVLRLRTVSKEAMLLTGMKTMR